MLFRLVRDPGTLSGSRFIWPYFLGPGTGPEGARAPHPFQSRQPRPSGPSLGNVSTVPGTRKRARPNSALTLDDHFRSDYTESLLAIRYLSDEVSVGGGADSFPENGRYTVDGVGARSIYTRKSTPS